MLIVVPHVYCDLNQDGDFSDANEDFSTDVYAISWNRGRSSVNEDFGAGNAEITMRYTNGKYCPFDTASAIYPNLMVGREVKIEAEHNSITYPVFRGRISDIHQVDDSVGGNPPSVVLSLQEDFARMSRSRYRSAASMLAGGLVSDILSDILDDFGVAVGMQDIDTSIQSVVAYWQQSGSHLDAAKAIVHQELGGAYYIARDGKHTFENRDARSLAAIHATFTGPQVLAMDLRESDWIDEVVFKRAGLDVSTATDVIYTQWPAGYELEPGSTDKKNTFHGDYIASAKNVVQPVPGLDYFANTVADGSGADVTNQVSVSAWASYGGGFEVTMNNASGAKAYLRLSDQASLVIRGQAVRQSDTTREITVSDGSAPVQNQALRDSFDFNDDVDAIRGYALFKLFAGSTFYPRNMQVRLEHQTDAEAVSLLGMELGKRVHITNTTGVYATTIDEDFFVEAISGRFEPRGMVTLECTLWHEIAALGNFFRISGAAGGGADYSTIASAVATTGDRIRP